MKSCFEEGTKSAMRFLRFLPLFCTKTCEAASSVRHIIGHAPDNRKNIQPLVPSSSTTPPRHLDLQDSSERGQDGSCHRFVSTESTVDLTVGRGIVFAVQSGDGDDDIVISSFGFSVDRSVVMEDGAVDYEVRVLRKNGFFASPERGNPPSLIGEDVNEPFDYRGDLSEWKLIANGKITESDLSPGGTTLNEGEVNFFKLPPGTFMETVPGKGGIRSFYIATRSLALYYSAPPQGTLAVNEVAPLVIKGDEHAPRLLTGEGSVIYPMDLTPLMYLTNSFLGKVFYETECPSLAPSVSENPSSTPTASPSSRPSSTPSLTSEPSSIPSEVPSDTPSSEPTEDIVIDLYEGPSLSLSASCEPGKDVGEDEYVAVADTVKEATVEEAMKQDPYIFNVNVDIVKAVCIGLDPLFSRHLLSDLSNNVNKRRYLPSSSSALDLSMVITGEYRPPSRPSEAVAQHKPNLGSIAEDSINRDPEGFVKDLQDRAESSSSLQQVEASDIIEVQAIEIEVGQVPPLTTRKPSAKPTASPTSPPDTKKDSGFIILICVVVIGGPLFLGAFVLCCIIKRQASKNEQESTKRKDEVKVNTRLDKQQMSEWDEVNEQQEEFRKERSARLEKQRSSRLERKQSVRLKKQQRVLEKQQCARIEKQQSKRLKRSQSERSARLERQQSSRLERQQSSRLERQQSPRQLQSATLEMRQSIRLEKSQSARIVHEMVDELEWDEAMDEWDEEKQQRRMQPQVSKCGDPMAYVHPTPHNYYPGDTSQSYKSSYSDPPPSPRTYRGLDSSAQALAEHYKKKKYRHAGGKEHDLHWHLNPQPPYYDGGMYLKQSCSDHGSSYSLPRQYQHSSSLQIDSSGHPHPSNSTSKARSRIRVARAA